MAESYDAEKAAMAKGFEPITDKPTKIVGKAPKTETKLMQAMLNLSLKALNSDLEPLVIDGKGFVIDCSALMNGKLAREKRRAAKGQPCLRPSRLRLLPPVAYVYNPPKPYNWPFCKLNLATW